MKVDLHMHTTCSDGLYAPDVLTRMAKEAQLDIIAISDHDTVDAYTGGYSFADGIRVIPAIEISSDYDGEDVHILGYYVNPHHDVLQAYCTQFKERRRSRAMEIVARCEALGYELDRDEIAATFAKGGTIGRPHIARMLVKKGYFSSVHDVFDRVLYRGGPAYVPYRRKCIEKCIEIIHAAGGLAVLAHPCLIKKGLSHVLTKPFDGIEVYHPKNHDHYDELLAIAKEKHWYVSGGSDFHGVSGRFPELVGIFTVDESLVQDVVAYHRK